MKLILDINNTKLLLTDAQTNALVNILHGCEHIEHRYMGRNAAGSEYADFIKPANLREVLKLGLMSDIEYDAMVFVTKQQDATN